MKENRTPHKLPARSAENRNGRGNDFSSKKLNKAHPQFLNPNFSLLFFPISFSDSISHTPFLLVRQFTNKSLNAAFSSVSEDSADLSPISEISDANPQDDVIVSSNLCVSSDFSFEFDLVRVYVNVSLFSSVHIDLC